MGKKSSTLADNKSNFLYSKYPGDAILVTSSEKVLCKPKITRALFLKNIGKLLEKNRQLITPKEM